VLVVEGEVIGDAGDRGVDVAAAEVLGADLLAVAAFTSGGRRGRSCRCRRTITVSSLIAGT
jgi:hypothetical protein